MIRCVDPSLSLPRRCLGAVFCEGINGVKFSGTGIPGGSETEGHKEFPAKSRIRIK